MLTKVVLLLVFLQVSSIRTRVWSSQPELLAGVEGPCDDCVDVRQCSAAIFASVVTLRTNTCAFNGRVPFVCCDQLMPKRTSMEPVFTHRPPLQLDNNGISELNPSRWDGFVSRHHLPPLPPPVYNARPPLPRGDPNWGHWQLPGVGAGFRPLPGFQRGPHFNAHGQDFPPPPPPSFHGVPDWPPAPYGPGTPREVGDSGGSPGGTTQVDETEPVGDSVEDRIKLLPTECGVTLEERIVGGQEASLGAFPWIARIGYNRNGAGPLHYRCGGALISARYVVTAAHCVASLPSTLTLGGVRLGELDTRQDPDCFALECADPVQDFSVEEAFVHPDYDNPRYTNDVALLRLDRPANIHAYVIPICLHLEPNHETNLTGQKVTVAGWGATKTDGTSSSPTLRWLRLTLSGPETCRSAYKRTGAAIDDALQLCAGGEPLEDSCDGDSGGPLSRPEVGEGGVPRQFLVGIVSFGARRCGTPKLPGVYTRISTYVDWIVDHLRP